MEGKIIKAQPKRELSLKQMVDIETKNRAILTQYVTEHMVEGIDYGGIHIAKNCQNKYNCDIPYHYSKDCLFKPGSEKFVSLMRLTIRFKQDADTWTMAGEKPGLFCYIAELINSKGEVIGEGRGSCDVSEKGNVNTAIKIAEKRAQIDAVLRSGGLSDFFTQDLEDMPETESEVLEQEDQPSVSTPSTPVPQGATQQHTLSMMKIELSRLIREGKMTEITFADLREITFEKAKQLLASVTT